MNENTYSVSALGEPVSIESADGLVSLKIGAATIRLPDNATLEVEAEQVTVVTGANPTFSVDGDVRMSLGATDVVLPDDVTLTVARPAKPARTPEPGSS